MCDFISFVVASLLVWKTKPFNNLYIYIYVLMCALFIRYIKPVFGGSSSEPPSPMFLTTQNSLSKSAQDEPGTQGSGVSHTSAFISHRKVDRTHSGTSSSNDEIGSGSNHGDGLTTIQANNNKSPINSSTVGGASSNIMGNKAPKKVGKVVEV